jgi:hypothetical protein
VRKLPILETASKNGCNWFERLTRLFAEALALISNFSLPLSIVK